MAADQPNDERVFRIQSDGCYYWTGLAADEQVLIGPLHNMMTAVFFDEAGRFLRCEQYPPRGLTGNEGFVEGRKAATQAVEARKAELGFHEATIRVRQFSLPDKLIGVFDLPWGLKQFLKDPDSVTLTDEDKRETTRELEEWRHSGNFVVVWGNDYFLTAEGWIYCT